MGGIPSIVTDAEVQSVFDTKAVIGRYYRKKSQGKISFAKVFIPNDKVDQALSQNFSLSGSKLREARWGKKPSTSARVSSTSGEWTKRLGRRAVPSRKIPSAACTTSVSNGLIKERAYFVAEFLAAQAPARAKYLKNLVVNNYCTPM